MKGATQYERRWRIMARDMFATSWSRRQTLDLTAMRLYERMVGACGRACANALLAGQVNQAKAWAEATAYFDRQRQRAWDREWHRRRHERPAHWS